MMHGEYFSGILGRQTVAYDSVAHKGWKLCPGCSKGHAGEHTDPCDCDMCGEDVSHG